MTSRFKIGSRVFEFAVLVGGATALGIAFVSVFGKTEDEKEANLRQKYPELVKNSQENKKHMKKFFDQMKHSDTNPEQQKLFEDLLNGGKNEKTNNTSKKSTN